MLWYQCCSAWQLLCVVQGILCVKAFFGQDKTAQNLTPFTSSYCSKYLSKITPPTAHAKHAPSFQSLKLQHFLPLFQTFYNILKIKKKKKSCNTNSLL